MIYLRIFSVLIFFIALVFSAPINFPINTAISIEKGQSQRSISSLLKEKNVISSGSIFNLCVSINSKGDDLKAGVYVFDRKTSVCDVARRIYEGDFGKNRLVITIPEGYDSKKILEELKERFPEGALSDEKVLKELKTNEGYLFPDTYYFFGNEDIDEIINIMRDNFEEKTKELKLETKRSWEDIVILASIIEKEANDEESRRMVSGILWKRLDNDMPLQVDAPFVYERNLNSFNLSIEDLEKDSVYNTYTRLGLTPTPISNPGLDSIDASINPKDSPYWFFLTDKNGNMHYAKTFEEHKLNKGKYLK